MVRWPDGPLWGNRNQPGLDPDNLPQNDPSAMDFSQSTGVKAWKHIWVSGQGIGAIKKMRPVADFVQQLVLEYRAAMAELQVKFASYSSSGLQCEDRR